MGYPPEELSDTVLDQPEWIKAGCGDKEYYSEEKGATFPGDECPEKLPDLSKHSNMLAEYLREHPEKYDEYKDKKTALGISLAKCIKTGIDNPGHPHIKTCGLVGGDEESFTLYKDIFDAVISARHGGYAPDAVHPTDMDVSNISTTKIDPTGKYVLTSRCRTGRSVRGFPLPPACSFDQRRELERIIVKGLNQMDGELKGEYFGLCGSQSTDRAMDKDKEADLRSNGNLFQEPDSTLLLSSGCGRHWPDARGIFHNEAKNFFVWLNEEDHMRIISMEKGDDIKAIFTRFANATATIQKILKEEGADFMHSEHLGFILSCPSNLGTGLRAGAMVKVPLFSARPDFKETLGKMGLQARGGAGVDSDSSGGLFDISNSDRLGKSETNLVNIFIEGVAQIIKWEQALEAGENIDDAVKDAKQMA